MKPAMQKEMGHPLRKETITALAVLFNFIR
jgi:hypothetical protein